MTALKQTEHESLSDRALEILGLLASGLSDREIAERVVMTINTVKWYNRQIYAILGVSSRTQAIARAHDLQLLDETDEAEAPAKPYHPPPKHNLPAETTHFIGRTHETADLIRMLESVRLLTLVGPPGTGKTRLSLHVAREVADTYRDGVYFVGLAHINDPARVINTIAAALGVNESQGQPLIETLKRVLRDSQTLLILDNFEHLLAAAPQVSDLLAAAPHLKVLATSREPLHLYGEQEYAVQPLALPDAAHIDPEALAACESIALFRQQARAVQSDFELTPENALDVAKICLRLEGLPLAIELAAARSKLLTPQALLARLDNRLDALTGSIRDLPPRQQTLRSTIDWSYNLLNDDEKMLFARLAVFRGERSLDAIETICGVDLPIDPLDGIESLLNKNLLRQQEGTDGEPRFIMLETLHEYARERLEASGEAQHIHWHHAGYFVALAEQAEPELRQAGFSYWMHRLEIEHHNLLIALEWSFSGGDTELGLRMVAALRDFWVMSGQFIEGYHWIKRGLQKLDGVSPALRVRVYTSAALLRFFSTESDERTWGKQLLEQAVNIPLEAGDQLIKAWVLTFLGAFSIAEPEGYEQAIGVTEQGLALFRERGHKPGMAQALNVIGELARNMGDDLKAGSAYTECLALVRQTGEKRRESMALNNLGFIARHHGDIERAEWLFTQGLIKSVELEHDKHTTVTGIIPLAGVIAAKGQLEQAVRILGAAEALLEPMGVGLQAGDQVEYDRDLVFIRSHFDDATFQKYWNEGRALTLEQTLALVNALPVTT